MADSLRELVDRFGPSVGRVEAIWLRPGRGLPMVRVAQAQAVPGRGLLGDRHAARESRTTAGSARDITLMQAEHLPAIARWVGRDAVDASLLRRNLLIGGVNLLALRSPFRDAPVRWRIGDEAVIEVTGPCQPCSKMETALGPGGYNAMRGHGGVTARVVVGGVVREGDVLTEYIDRTAPDA